jgi:hypothetical protein
LTRTGTHFARKRDDRGLSVLAAAGGLNAIGFLTRFLDANRYPLRSKTRRSRFIRPGSRRWRREHNSATTKRRKVRVGALPLTPALSLIENWGEGQIF